MKASDPPPFPQKNRTHKIALKCFLGNFKLLLAYGLPSAKLADPPPPVPLMINSTILF